MHNLARAKNQSGLKRTASRIGTEALAMYEKTLGVDHPHTRNARRVWGTKSYLVDAVYTFPTAHANETSARVLPQSWNLSHRTECCHVRECCLNELVSLSELYVELACWVLQGVPVTCNERSLYLRIPLMSARISFQVT